VEKNGGRRKEKGEAAIEKGIPCRGRLATSDRPQAAAPKSDRLRAGPLFQFFLVFL
jgi:hypothetical protein